MERQRWYDEPKVKFKQRTTVSDIARDHPMVIFWFVVDVILGAIWVSVTFGE